MSWTIWKAPFDKTGATRQTVKVPKGAELLSVGHINGQAYIWFGCNPLNPLEDRDIAVCTTGGEAPPPEDARFIGTAAFTTASGGAYIFHIFERKPR